MANISGTRISRVESIDFLRGVVMIIMALDHVRDLFHADTFRFDPVDLNQTSPSLFFTRWITHLCAPTFIFLAGASAYFVSRRKTISETRFFLVSRGLWLIVLQYTVVRFAWNMDPAFHYNGNSILFAIGFCMIVLAFLIQLKWSVVLMICLAIILGHNVLDGISFEQGTFMNVVWAVLHVPTMYELGNGYKFYTLYPGLPWVGVIALGYCFGRFYEEDFLPEQRKKILLWSGLGALTLFVIVRFINAYGDPMPWQPQETPAGSVMAFFNVQKYPPSLLYVAATLGISLLILRALDGKSLSNLKFVTLFGNVSFFYYVIHLFAIHLLAILAAVWMGFPVRAMVFEGTLAQGSALLKGYGFELGTVYLVWISIVVMLYPLCVVWNSFKNQNKGKWWVSYV